MPRHCAPRCASAGNALGPHFSENVASTLGRGGAVQENAVTRRNYQPLQMHRMTWTDLSEDQVLQGQLSERRWESGRLEAGYVNTGAGWKIAKLEYRG